MASHEEEFEELAKEEKQVLRQRLRDWKIVRDSNLYL